MKLQLRNIRCHVGKELTFRDGDMTLISGQSGAGKSSIFHAVVFALFGTGTKIATTGKTGCGVELVIGDMTIVRTKRPNRMTLAMGPPDAKVVYEDETAQHIINKRFGSSPTFSYVPQNMVESFVTMSPSGKLEFLEQFIFDDTPIEDIKNRSRNMVRETNDALVAVSAQLEMLQSMFKDEVIQAVANPLAEVTFSAFLTPVTASVPPTPAQFEEYVQTLGADRTLISQRLADVDRRMYDLEMVKNRCTDSHRRLEQLKLKIAAHPPIVEVDQARYDQLTADAQAFKLIDLYQRIESELAELKVRETEAIQAEMATLTPFASRSERDTQSELDDRISTLKDLTQVSELMAQIANVADTSKHSATITSLESQIETLRAQLLLMCPCCKSALQMVDGKLVGCASHSEHITGLVPGQAPSKPEAEIKRAIAKLTSDIDRLRLESKMAEQVSARNNELIHQAQTTAGMYGLTCEDAIDSIAGVQEEIDELNAYLSAQQEASNHLDRLKKNLEQGIFSVSYSIKKKELARLSLPPTPVSTREECQELSSLAQAVRSAQESKALLDELTSEAQALTSTIAELLKGVKAASLASLDSKIATLKTGRETITASLTSIVQAIGRMEQLRPELIKYKEYLAQVESRKEMQFKINKLAADERRCKDLYTQALVLRGKIVEAESLALEYIVSDVNLKVSQFLETFFADDIPICTITLTKEVKGVEKYQIGLKVEYKGLDSDISQLSGGELSRVMLAFALTFSSMYNSPLLMLDESNASLDAEISEMVVEGIKTLMRGKTILVISHQATSTNIFDSVIKV